MLGGGTSNADVVRGLCEFKHCTVSQAQSHRRRNQKPTNFVGLSMAPMGVDAAGRFKRFQPPGYWNGNGSSSQKSDGRFPFCAWMAFGVCDDRRNLEILVGIVVRRKLSVLSLTINWGKSEFWITWLRCKHFENMGGYFNTTYSTTTVTIPIFHWNL